MYKNARTKVSLNSLAESAASTNYRLALQKMVVRLGLPKLPEARAKVLLFENSSRQQLVGAGINDQPSGQPNQSTKRPQIVGPWTLRFDYTSPGARYRG